MEWQWVWKRRYSIRTVPTRGFYFFEIFPTVRARCLGVYLCACLAHIDDKLAGARRQGRRRANQDSAMGTRVQYTAATPAVVDGMPSATQIDVPVRLVDLLD